MSSCCHSHKCPKCKCDFEHECCFKLPHKCCDCKHKACCVVCIKCGHKFNHHECCEF
jgi:hypothetical protein